jgi:hypothetical protein
VNGQVRSSNIRVRTTKKNERTRTLAAIKNEVRAKLTKMPFVDGKVADPEFMQGAPYEPPINVFVRGDDLGELQRISNEIQAKVRQVPGAVDISTNLESGQPEVVAQVDRSLAADLGFSVGSIGTQLRGMVEGIVPTKLRDGDREYDIRVRLAPEYRNDPAAVLRTPLYSPTGTGVRAADVARFGPAVGPSNIDREQRRRQAKIGVDIASGYALGDVTKNIEKALATVQMPANFEWGFAGDVELMQESAAALGLALILAVAFIYIVLASQFESFLEPFIIIALAAAGNRRRAADAACHRQEHRHAGHDRRRDADGAGDEERDPAVDYTNQLRREGLPVKDALLKAGPVRLRPIIMTTIAMILGMTPSAFGTGDGSEFRAPISIATIGGLLTSTLLTLVVVPVAYLLLHRGLIRVRAWREAPMPAWAKTAARVAGILVAIGLLGAFLTVARVFAEPESGQSSTAPSAQHDRALTIDDALQLAVSRNESLKVTQERLRESQAHVSEAGPRSCPSLNLNFLYTPTQASPLLKIPAGVFGPNEQTFRANLVRQNVMRFESRSRCITGGRLANAYAAQAAGEESSRLDLERSRQALVLQVYESFYAALMNEQGIRVSEEGVTIAAEASRPGQMRDSRPAPRRG